ncbi:hypothetical protein K469DRAFT_710656 [Zopfia rhizophila CBS 207.26]|uniref:Uncharacterized protein n=1 Tax=Zopfia rhizophila CBS 207.26 TaxID=1314779 RepID=A0A6A6DYX6_9PEZI|nr:hypothetical protein K469DRAFT_710656 [Zopfia rhizophila CBS 207.26]
MSVALSTTTLTEKELEGPPVDIKTLSEKEKQELSTSDTISIASGTTLAPGDAPFYGVKSLHINTKGIPVLRLPLPPSELQISIHNPDGTLAYLSTRERRSSGNSILSDTSGNQLIGTTYFFGPSRDPVLHILGTESQEIRTVSKWTSRCQKFLLPDGRTFEWEYKKEKGVGDKGKKGTALALSMDGKRMAMLVRNKDTRTEGSKGCSAGNGGELVLGRDVGMEKEGLGLSEEVVVATCLLMLKKEVDRRRTIQFMVLLSAAHGS